MRDNQAAAERRILSMLQRRALDAARLRDRAARTGNSVAAYAFGVLADELADTVRDAETMAAEERAIAAARGAS